MPVTVKLSAIELVKRLLEIRQSNGKPLSHLAISRASGVSRYTVAAVAAGDKVMYLDDTGGPENGYVNGHQNRHTHKPKHQQVKHPELLTEEVEPYICSGCSHKVCLDPCKICETREYRKRMFLSTSNAVSNAKPLNQEFTNVS